MSASANALTEPSTTATPSSESLFQQLVLRSCCYDHHQASQRHRQQSIPLSRSKNPVPLEILGHRGAGCSVVGGESVVPENSIAAFERAVELGLTAVEIDVWLTADNEVVVLHGAEDDGFLYETVAVPTGGPRSEPQRIELLNYSEWSKAGLLRHRQPWPLFITSSTQSSVSSLHDQGEFEEHQSSDKEEPENAPNCPRQAKVAACSCNRVILPSAGLRQLTNDLSSSKTAATAPIDYRYMNSKQRETERLRYFEAAELFFLSNNQMASEVPLLRTVFARFHGRLQFNVELKGTNPLLGPLVLKIARDFPGIISRISSFHWKVAVEPDHELFGESVPIASYLTGDSNQDNRSGDENTTVPDSRESIGAQNDLRIFSPNNYFSHDLMKPLVANNDGVPLALLFEGETLPSVHAIISSMRHYKATWAHVPQMFYLSSIVDQAQVAKLRSPFLSNVRVQKILSELKCNCPGTDRGSKTINSGGTTTTRSLRTDTIEALVNASLNLSFLTWSLQAENFRVLIYSGHMNEHPAAMQLALLSGIDGVCVNDISSGALLSTMCRSLLAEV